MAAYLRRSGLLATGAPGSPEALAALKFSKGDAARTDTWGHRWRVCCSSPSKGRRLHASAISDKALHCAPALLGQSYRKCVSASGDIDGAGFFVAADTSYAHWDLVHRFHCRRFAISPSGCHRVHR